MTTDRDDDFGALDLDDMPGIPPPAFVEWVSRHHFAEIDPHDGWRRFHGVIEGVPFEATCEVTA